MKLADRLARVKPSATLAASARAQALRARGVDVVGLAAGEPDFATPAHVIEAAKTALDRGATRYTASGGTPELRAAAAEWLGRAHGFRLAPEEVLVSCGAKHSLTNLFQALLSDGDEVLIPTPAWLSYPDMVALAGGVPVLVPTRAEDGYAPSAAALAARIGPRTRLLVLNSPSNPTGAVLSDEQLAPIARLVVERDLLAVSDDIYRALVYDAVPGHLWRHGEEIRRRTVLIDGVSKAYAMTGFRIGFAVGPRPLIDAMDTLQSQSTSNPAAVAQAAALAALTGPQECVETMRRAFDARRRKVVERLRAIPGVRLVEPRGAFYAFPDVSRCPGTRGRDDEALAADLIDEQGLVLVAGAPFGGPGCLRLSYAASDRALDEGITRLRRAMEVSP